MLKLLNNKGFKWKSQSYIHFKGYLNDQNGEKDDELIFSELSTIKSKEQFTNWLVEANGSFSVILELNDHLLFAVDKLRTFPLFYSTQGNDIVITDNPVEVFKGFKIDELAALEFECAAYITGNKTLYKNVFQVQGGEFVEYAKQQITCDFYSDFYSRRPTIDDSNFESLQNRFVKTLDQVFEPFVKSLKNKQVIIPLSGGYDSRLIATMFKKYGHENIYSFTYGRKDNCELENASETAKKLGLPWKFIEYNKELVKGYFTDKTFRDYYHFAGKASSMFYMQDYFAVKFLHDNHLIENDAVFVPGHSGDALAGSHLRAFMSEKTDVNKMSIIIYDFVYFRNHRKRNKKLLDLIKSVLAQMPKDILNYSLYEHWVYKELQTKYIINSAAVFDFFGYEYRMPIWDNQIFSFFKSTPFEYKLYEDFYKKTLNQYIFRPYDIDFTKNLAATPFQTKLQKYKDKIRPYLPMKVKQYFLKKNDWRYYGEISEPLLGDLKTKNIKYKFKGDAYNSIISKWYVEDVKTQQNQ